VLTILDLKNRKKLLDVGSGPGAYAIQFCQHYPELHATLFDRETTKPFARDMIKCHGLEDRITFSSGDFNVDKLGSNYDVIWGSHILHSNPITDVQALINTFFDALQPGGELLIQELILDDSKCSPQFPALFSLNMLLNTPDGRSYAQGELEEMMREAGFNHLSRLEPPGPASILRAVKPE
jgi:cyclopropane fatty-acyl-phospholipid synthase-like methyltransferase